MSLNLRKEGYPVLIELKRLQTIFGVSRWTLRDWFVKRKLAGLQWVRMPNGRLGATRESTQLFLENNFREI